jgi:hypothetical protein
MVEEITRAKETHYCKTDKDLKENGTLQNIHSMSKKRSRNLLFFVDRSLVALLSRNRAQA